MQWMNCIFIDNDIDGTATADHCIRQRARRPTGKLGTARTLHPRRRASCRSGRADDSVDRSRFLQERARRSFGAGGPG